MNILWTIHSESESELGFSFPINSVPDFDSTSESDSESDFSLDICIFFTMYLYSSK